MTAAARGELSGRRIGLLTFAASRLGGGVFEAVVAQASMIRQHGGEAIIFALDDAHFAEDAARLGETTARAFPIIGPRQIGYAPQMVQGLLDAELDLLHIHGIWMYPSRAGTLWARRTRRPYLISPHAMFSEWIMARGKAKKRLAWHGYERTSVRAAHLVHALTAREAADIARETGRSGCITIPNPGPVAMTGHRAIPGRNIVYIGRVHPIKNLHALVQGWQMAQLPDDARLIMAGWGDPASVAELTQAVAAAGPQVSFIGPIYGEAKAELIAGARFIVLPSHSEGLPMAVLEGWAQGTPNIMTAACNLPAGFAEGASLECGAEPAQIAQTLTEALAKDDAAWRAMSQAALGLARGPFSREAVAAHWAGVYASAMADGRGGTDAA